MSKKMVLSIALLGLAACASASASIYEFTATSTGSGVLGTLQYDSSVFDGTAFQFVANTNILAIDFTDPVTLLHVTTPGPPSEGTFFDSTGLLPTVVGGGGFTGGTDSTNGVLIADTFFVAIGPTSFFDVFWSTAVIAVPEPISLALVLTGLAGLTVSRRKGAANPTV